MNTCKRFPLLLENLEVLLYFRGSLVLNIRRIFFPIRIPDELVLGAAAGNE